MIVNNKYILSFKFNGVYVGVIKHKDTIYIGLLVVSIKIITIN
jgi:hypothetical protein